MREEESQTLEYLKALAKGNLRSNHVDWTQITKDCKIDLSQNVEEPHPLIQIGSIPVMTSGNLSVVGGRAKTRKSFFCIGIAAAFLSGECLGMTAEPLPEKDRCLFIDTEQSKPYTQRTGRRIHRLCGWDTNLDNDKLIILNLREQNPGERIEVFKAAVLLYDPGLVIIDGIRDFSNDFNDSRESTEVVSMLMKYSSKYQAHIVTVLHENKEGGNLRGHLGAELTNKSESVLTVSKDGEVSTVIPTMTRNMPFDDIFFRINDSGLPERTQALDNKTRKEDIKQYRFDKVLPGQLAKSYTDTVQQYMQIANVCETTAKNHLHNALSMGYVVKNQNGSYYFNRNTNEVPF